MVSPGLISIMTRSPAQASTSARPDFMSTVNLQPTSTFLPCDSTTSLPESTRISVFMSNVPHVAGSDLIVRLDVDAASKLPALDVAAILSPPIPNRPSRI